MVKSFEHKRGGDENFKRAKLQELKKDETHKSQQ